MYAALFGMEAAEAAKAKGNAAFKTKQYAEARQHYTAAIELCACARSSGNGTSVEFVAPCYANRALVSIKMDMWPDALADATSGLARIDAAPAAARAALAAIVPKLHFRKGLALRGLGQLKEALHSFQTAAAVEEGVDSGGCSAGSAGSARGGTSKAMQMQIVEVMQELAQQQQQQKQQQRAMGGGEGDFSKATPSTIGSDFKRFLYRPRPDGADTSLLVLLHGLGDKPEPFFALGKQMALPQCALLAVEAPAPLLDLGFCWYPGFNQMGEELAPGCAEQVAGLTVVRGMLQRLLVRLEAAHGWDRRDVYFLGFSQGGTVALDLALHLGGSGGGSGGALGGVVSVSGPLFEWHTTSKGGSSSSSSSSPVLMTLGSKDPRVEQSKAQREWSRLKQSKPDATQGWKLASFPRGHVMISSQPEMKAVLEFLDGRFRLRNLSLERDPDVRTAWQTEAE